MLGSGQGNVDAVFTLDEPDSPVMAIVAAAAAYERQNRHLKLFSLYVIHGGHLGAYVCSVYSLVGAE